MASTVLCFMWTLWRLGPVDVVGVRDLGPVDVVGVWDLGPVDVVGVRDLGPVDEDVVWAAFQFLELMDHRVFFALEISPIL